VSKRFVVYSPSTALVPTAALLAALKDAGARASWEPRSRRDRGERWSNGTVVTDEARIFVSNRPLGDAARRELLEYYAHAREQLVDSLAASKRVYVVDSEDDTDLVRRTAAAIAKNAPGVVVDEATGELFDRFDGTSA
jgi:hypothetical protein